MWMHQSSLPIQEECTRPLYHIDYRYYLQSQQLYENREIYCDVKSRRVCEWSDGKGGVKCGIDFPDLHRLVDHINTVHVGGKDQTDHSCWWIGCNRKLPFKAKYKLVNHLRTHTGERPFRCNYCGGTFAQSENLTIHTRTHTKEKPYQCPVEGCGKTFANSSDRKKHSYSHNTTKQHTCKICEKCYVHACSLRKHIKSCHPPKEPERLKRKAASQILPPSRQIVNSNVNV